MKIYIELESCKLLGTGAEGSVFLSPEGYALKKFNSKKAADHESSILNIMKDSRFFPNLYLQVSNLIIREYVSGINLYDYIDKYGLSSKISYEIIDFIEDLRKYKFKRINIRNAHIFIDRNETLKVIDPRKPFSKSTPYPKDIIKVLLKLKLFDKFLNDLTYYKPHLLEFWVSGYNYVAQTNKVSRYE